MCHLRCVPAWSPSLRGSSPRLLVRLVDCVAARLQLPVENPAHQVFEPVDITSGRLLAKALRGCGAPGPDETLAGVTVVPQAAIEPAFGFGDCFGERAVLAVGNDEDEIVELSRL